MGSPIIFSGSNAKLLKQNLDFFGSVSILSGSVNPSSVATSAPAGSLYLNNSTGTLYRKTDAGLSTNWLALSGTNTGDQTITLTSDVTGSGTGSFATTVAKIAGTTVSGTTGSTNVVFSSAPTLSNPIVGTQTTTDNSTKAASTAYVTTAIANAVAGVNPAVAVQAATTASGDTSSLTYNNGVSGIGATLTGANNTALTVDGYTFTAIGQRLLVKNDTQSPSGAFNGVYYVTQVQALALPLILTRALDFDTPSDMNNTGAIPVVNGTTNGTTQWLLTSTVTTVGTDALTFVKFTRNPADYLLKSSGDLDETSFSAANNISSPTNVTGLAFSNSTVRSAEVLVSVFVNATSSLYEAFNLILVQKGAAWEIAQNSVGDASGFVFTVTTAGQIQYTNSNYTGFSAATVKFRARTTSV